MGVEDMRDFTKKELYRIAEDDLKEWVKDGICTPEQAERRLQQVKARIDQVVRKDKGIQSRP